MSGALGRECAAQGSLSRTPLRRACPPSAQRLLAFSAPPTHGSQRRHSRRVAPCAFTTQTTHASSAEGTASPSALLQSDDAQSEAGAQAPAFDWARNWYPVANVADLDTERPNSLQLLGKQVAVWQDRASGVWHAVEDRCPHRMAALSDGHVSSTGDIVCPYHGWQFDAEGKCTHNPQSIDAAAERSANGSSRSRVAPFPVQPKQGVLWLWGQAGSEEFIHSAAQPLPVAKEAEEPGWVTMPYGTSTHPVDYTVMTENSFDPSHSNFVHGGTFEARKDATPMIAKLKTAIDPVAGFMVEHSAYSGKPDSLHAERHFIPPCTLRATYKSGPTTRIFMVHLVPVQPGVSRSFFQLCFQQPASAQPGGGLRGAAFKLWKALQPAWLVGFMHLAGSQAADQDSLVLHRQDQRLRRADLAAAAAGSKKRGWRQYYMATPSDVAVDAFRRWLTMAGGAPAFEGTQPYQPELSEAQLYDRWNRHVSHCKACQKTAQAMGQLQRALGVASWVCGFAAVWLASAAGVGSAVVGAAIASRSVLGVPMPVIAAAAAALCCLFCGRADAARKEFHVPERLTLYPLNDPHV